jgi:CO/xanthine dehydrogenase FAD-binding subunit
MLQAVLSPGSLPEAHSNLSKQESPKIIAGGTAVMPVLNYGTDKFTSLVSLRRAGLAGISIKDGAATIGATTTLSELEETDALSFLRPALDAIASPTIRNMATVGGNLFVKQPYGDLAVCLIALGATARISSSKGEWSESVENLVKTGVGDDEILTETVFTLPAADTFKFTKAGRKALNSAAVVTVAAIVNLADGKVADCRIALGAVASHPVRAVSVERALIGKPLDRPSVEAAAREAVKDIEPLDDAYASAWYRTRVTPVHIRRALIGE